MNILIKTIPHSDQRYPTVGDWYKIIRAADDKRVELEIPVSNLGNDNYQFLVGLHEMIEAWLCMNRGITMEMVDDFDKSFVGDEPGDSPDAPYHKEHKFAMNIERMMAEELGVDWDEYERALNDCVS